MSKLLTRDASAIRGFLYTELRRVASAAVGTYELFTANDVVKRDPVSWSFERRTHAGDWEILAVVSDFDVPLDPGSALLQPESKIDAKTVQ